MLSQIRTMHAKLFVTNNFDVHEIISSLTEHRYTVQGTIWGEIIWCTADVDLCNYLKNLQWKFGCKQIGLLVSIYLIIMTLPVCTKMLTLFQVLFELLLIYLLRRILSVPWEAWIKSDILRCLLSFLVNEFLYNSKLYTY